MDASLICLCSVSIVPEEKGDRELPKPAIPCQEAHQLSPNCICTDSAVRELLPEFAMLGMLVCCVMEHINRMYPILRNLGY